MMQKKARKQFAEGKQTKDMDYWNHVLWSDETKINVFGSDVSSVCGANQVRSTKTSVSCLQSSKVVGESWSGAAWVLPAMGSYSSLKGTMNANMHCDILKQSMIPSLRRLGRKAVFQHDNDHWLAKEAKSKGDGLAKHVSRPKPYWASVGHPQAEGGGAQGLLHPPAPWCRHGGVEEDSSGNLWSSGELHSQEG